MVDVAEQPLLLARGKNGAARVFYDVSPIVAPISSPRTEQARVITCKYHAWTFELDGPLRARAHFDGPDAH